MFVDAGKWESDPEYRKERDAEMRASLDAGAARAEETFGELKRALDARGLTTETLHTGGGIYNLAIDLDPTTEEMNREGWRLLIGEPQRGDAGNIAWEASIEDEEGPLDSIFMTLNQMPGEPVSGLASQLASLVLRLTARASGTA